MSIRTRCKVCRRLKVTDPTINEADCQKHKERNYLAIAWNGTSQIRDTFPTKYLAEQWESKIVREAKAGTYRKIEDIDFPTMADKWVAAQDPELEIQSLIFYKMIINKQIKPILGRMRLSSVTPEDIAQVRAYCRTKSNSTRKHVNRIMGSIFKLALLYDYIAKDPTILPSFQRQKKRKVRKEEAVPNIWTPPQIQHFMKYARQVNKLYYKFIIFCGLRPQEICGLNDDAIDAKRSKVSVGQVIHWTKYKEEREHHKGQRFMVNPKLKSIAGYRELPITKEMLDEITFHQLQRAHNRENLLFITSIGTPFNMAVKSKEFNKDAAEARKTMPDLPKITFYKLRHTFCSNLISRGWDLKTVQELMGHDDERLIMKIYGHVMRHKKDYAAIATDLESFILGKEEAAKVI